jgi:hypothetical protein
MSTQLAAGIMEESRAPFAVMLTRLEQEKYYLEKYGHFVFNEDGTPNEMGRDSLLEAFGPDAFAEIVDVVLRHRTNQEALTAAFPPYEYPRYADEEPGTPTPNPPPLPFPSGGMNQPPPDPGTLPLR